VISVDVLRGLTILAMIFVNDLAGVAGTPAWLQHFHPSQANGMTLVDVVFPAFLFIVGLAIPSALSARRRHGESVGAVLRHIVMRTLSLLVIGVLMVNADHISDQGVLDPDLWVLLMYAAVFLIWTRVRSAGERQRAHGRWLEVAGVLLLALLALLYRGDNVGGVVQLRPMWWGILGLIGWAYLVATAAYLLLGKRRWAVLAAAASLFAGYCAVESGWLAILDRLLPFVQVSSMLCSHPATVLLGVFVGTFFLPGSPLPAHAGRLGWGVVFAAGCAAAGWLLYLPHQRYPFLIVNKVLATPPWCLFSSAITVALLVVVYWLIDINGWSRWSRLAEWAGKNALLAYIAAPIVYAALGLVATVTGTPHLMDLVDSPFPVGLARAVVFSLALTAAAGLLWRKGIVLKL